MGIFDWSWVQILEYASRLFLAALVGTPYFVWLLWRSRSAG